jgi:hypothetical protein
MKATLLLLMMLALPIGLRASYIEVWDSVMVVDTKYEIFFSDTTSIITSWERFIIAYSCPVCPRDNLWDSYDGYQCYLKRYDTTYQRVSRKVEWPYIPMPSHDSCKDIRRETTVKCVVSDRDSFPMLDSSMVDSISAVQP